MSQAANVPITPQPFSSFTAAASAREPSTYRQFCIKLSKRLGGIQIFVPYTPNSPGGRRGKTYC